MAFPIFVSACMVHCLVNPYSGQAFSAFLSLSWIKTWSVSLSHPVSIVYLFMFIPLVTNHTVTFLLLHSLDSTFSAPLRWFFEIRQSFGCLISVKQTMAEVNSVTYTEHKHKRILKATALLFCICIYLSFSKGLLKAKLGTLITS